MNQLEGIRDYLRRYPGLEGLLLGYLPREPGSCSLEPVPCDPVIREYMDGGQRRRAQLQLLVRGNFGSDQQEQGENLSRLMGLARWLEDMEQAGDLPELGEREICLSLRATSREYLISADSSGRGIYVLDLEMEYFRGRQQ